MSFKIEKNKVIYTIYSDTPKKTSKIGDRLWSFIEAIGLAHLFGILIGRSRPTAKPADLKERVRPGATPAQGQRHISFLEHKAVQEPKEQEALKLLGEVKEITKKGSPTIEELKLGFAKIKEIEALKIENEDLNIEAEREHNHLQIQFGLLRNSK